MCQDAKVTDNAIPSMDVEIWMRLPLWSGLEKLLPAQAFVRFLNYSFPHCIEGQLLASWVAFVVFQFSVSYRWFSVPFNQYKHCIISYYLRDGPRSRHPTLERLCWIFLSCLPREHFFLFHRSKIDLDESRQHRALIS